MQELRFVLIIVGALAIAALLFHGLWTSRKEGKAKFGNKPLGKVDSDSAEETSDLPQRSFAPEDDFEIIKKERKEPDFSAPVADPLIESEDSTQNDSIDNAHSVELNDIPSFSVEQEPTVSEPQVKGELASSSPEPDSFDANVSNEEEITSHVTRKVTEDAQHEFETQPESEDQPALEVIALNVHCAGDTPFIGTELFKSMEDNGLRYGEMSIFHYHSESSVIPKVIFSVANMMQPGTLEHDNPADFSTKGISFFMTLPCYGEADQNFNTMLKTAQKIADDLGGNVLDEARNLMTPNRLSDYRKQIRDFKDAPSET